MNKIAVCCYAVALAISVPAACRADAAKWDPRMANVQAAVDIFQCRTGDFDSIRTTPCISLNRFV